MKKTFLLFFLISAFLVVDAQSPMGINYQTIVRDAAGQSIANDAMSVKISIRKASIGGSVVYCEIHEIVSNNFGLINIIIGQGIVESGNFAEIDWGREAYYFETAIDISGSKEYQVMGVTQFLSVPYALHASSLTLTDVNGNIHTIQVDTNGNITSKQHGKWYCGDSLIDERDGNIYPTVQIGNQCWMAANLNIGTIINAELNMTNNDTIEKYCFNGLSTSCDIYGGLYQWDEAMEYIYAEGSTGICPEGWHIGSDTEWAILTDYLGGEAVAGGKLKEVGTEHWFEPNVGATNSSGFTGLPASYRKMQGYVVSPGLAAYFWSSTPSFNPGLAWLRELFTTNYMVQTSDSYTEFGYSVRCLKDNSTTGNLPPSNPYNPIPENGSENQPLEIVLQWDCNDPEGDTLTYDLYFGDEGVASRIATGIQEKFYVISNLDYSTAYNWQVVAFDELNSAIGPVWEFSTIQESTGFDCGDTLVDERDGRTYQTVVIEDRCWMAENINIGNIANEENDMSNDGVIQKYCYNNSPLTCNTYGGLYQWEEAMAYSITEGAQGICMEGWHIPTNDEYSAFVEFLGGSNVAGGKMKEAGEEYWYSPNTGATNSSGFTGLPASFRALQGYVEIRGYGANFWSSSQEELMMPWNRSLYYNSAAVTSSSVSASYGFSVRCIHNENTFINLPPTTPSNPFPQNGADNQPTQLTLSWDCSDPENDPLTFDVYFGINEEELDIFTTITDPYVEMVISSPVMYWKIVAKDDHGNSTESPIWYFSTIENSFFSCGDTYTDERDGQNYHTVQIDDQCWMKENLNIGQMILTPANPSNNETIEKYCYDNEIENCDEYGGLYMWNEMMNYTSDEITQGICPDGWHIPTTDEWATLTNYLGGLEVAGGKLKEIGMAHWQYPNTGGTNTSGFTGLPAGNIAFGNFTSLYLNALFWSSSQSFGGNAWTRGLVFQNAAVAPAPLNKENYGISVRCIKD